MADLNGDGVINTTDQNLVLSNWGTTSPGNRQAGDTNADGNVDNDDLALITTNFGAGVGSTTLHTPSNYSAKLPFSGAALSTIAFQGLRLDETTGLIDNRYRVYDPRLQRYLQPDPLGYPDGLNRYAAYHVLRRGVDPNGQEYIPIRASGVFSGSIRTP
ncbi:MAG: RHS repeat-associated core domain-containing protein [Planctomycetota bacterium]